MQTIWRMVVLAHLGVSSVAGAQGAQAPQGPQSAYARLRGTVLDASTSAPVVGAQVSVAATGRTVITDSIGRFELGDLPSGVIRFYFSAAGFPRASVVLALAPREIMVQRFELDSSRAAADSAGSTKRVQELDPTTVTAEASRGVRYADFERRMRTGRGQYLTRQQIEAAGYASLTDAARTLRGVNVECGGGRECYIRMARAQRGCLPEYVVDGTVDPFFGPQVAIRDIEGLEFYTGASDVPGEFAGRNAGCGVVVIWTKSGPPKPKPRSP